jgi:hypothetical protein
MESSLHRIYMKYLILFDVQHFMTVLPRVLDVHGFVFFFFFDLFPHADYRI